MGEVHVGELVALLWARRPRCGWLAWRVQLLEVVEEAGVEAIGALAPNYKAMGPAPALQAPQEGAVAVAGGLTGS